MSAKASNKKEVHVCIILLINTDMSLKVHVYVCSLTRLYRQLGFIFGLKQWELQPIMQQTME